MPFAPLENLRRCVIASPPWVIFTISLAIMAFGVLILACRLRYDSNYAMQPNLVTAHFCVTTPTNVKNSAAASSKNASTNNETETENNILTIPVFVSAKNDFYHDLRNRSATNGDGIKWTGAMHDGQLGLKGADANSTLQFEIRFESTTSRGCVDETCDYVLLHACAVVRNVAESHKKAHATVEEDAGNAACNNRKIVGGSDGAGAILRNRLDYSDPIDADRFSANSGRENWCANGSVVSVQKRDSRGFVLIPLLHDTLAARLHLLYTSYFLFTSILILIVYATCRRTTHHSKSTTRTPESAYSHYSKLSNERE